MGSLFGNIARGIGGAVMTVARSPLAKAVPYLGAASTILSVGSALLPSGSAGPAMPAMPGGFAGPAGNPMANPLMGDRGWFQNDPNVQDWMKPMAISKTNLKVCYRAPKGFVIRYDEVGDPYGIPKEIARKFLGWKPAKKPLLSIRDTNAIRHAGRAIKKLQGAEKMAKKIANWKSPPRRQNIIVTGRTVGRKAIAA